MRCAIDTGGTFTDLALEHEGEVRIFKTSTTPEDPIRGILEVLALAAQGLGMERAELLSKIEMLIHGTTRATNAVLTGNTAKTALITTMGHRDVLLLREGGRGRAFDWSVEYTDAYIPRALTYEAPERIDAQGRVLRELDEPATIAILDEIAACEVEAVAVCLLWSIVNPAHEQRIGELLAERLPGVPYTLSHALNPTLREYRRASSTAIDASLKPLMTRYLSNLEQALTDAGFGGELLVISTAGGLMHAREAAKVPITSINSGPAMAPVAGRHFAAADPGAQHAIVADTGGTSYDVSVVRDGRIPMTRETWLGEPLTGHITGFPAVDVKSIGAGGGSIAWIDDGGLLHVGPQSAGADPGPACYGRGGERPTVTDACLTLGYLDAERFLGGAMKLDEGRARAAIDRDVARPLGLDTHEAASAILALATEHMVQAITEITVDAGIDPRGAVLIGGGGAAGLNSGGIMRRLGARALVIPETGAVLSAVGALMADLSADFSAACFTSSEHFDGERVDAVLDELRERCRAFATQVGAQSHRVELIAEARLARQVWQIDVPLRAERFAGDEGAMQILLEDFRRLHEEIFAVLDEHSAVEIVALRTRVVCPLDSTSEGRLTQAAQELEAQRDAFFPGHGLLPTSVRSLDTIDQGTAIAGPAIVESPLTTVVVEPGSSAERRPGIGLLVTLENTLEQEGGRADAGTVNG
ncbi:MAG TPA: hydantoinase/oxoprolinase family protein [Solirubrobacteraceae bacterium]|nr:hydantoinase/oxoprolinase family protein [Solirubrobacteraceae bacterium]